MGFPAAKDLQKHGFKSVAESAIDQDVDRAVDGDEQIGHLDDLSVVNAEQLEDVVDQRQDVADEEDHHDDQQHHGQIVFPLLLIRKHGSSRVRLPKKYIQSFH